MVGADTRIRKIGRLTDEIWGLYFELVSLFGDGQSQINETEERIQHIGKWLLGRINRANVVTEMILGAC
jgi:hypothetical protein